MYAQGNELRELTRGSPLSESALGPGKPSGNTQLDGASAVRLELVGALDCQRILNMESSARTYAHPLPLAPLQRTTLYDKRNIAQFLTFTEAISLMLAATDLHVALQHDPQLRLDEISPYMQTLPLTRMLQRLQSLDREITQMQSDALAAMMSRQSPVTPALDEAAGPMTAGAATPAVSTAMRMAQGFLKMQRARSAIRTQRIADRLIDTAIRAKRQERSECQSELAFFEPALEGVVVHFARERMHGPRKGQARETGAIARTLKAEQTLQGFLRAADEESDSALESALLREFLSLPTRLMPNAQKVQWLQQPMGMASQEAFVRTSFGSFEPLNLRRFDAYATRITEIAGSKYLDRTDKAQILTHPADIDLFHIAVSNDNYAVAALLLLGIHESSQAQRLEIVHRHAGRCRTQAWVDSQRSSGCRSHPFGDRSTPDDWHTSRRCDICLQLQGEVSAIPFRRQAKRGLLRADFSCSRSGGCPDHGGAEDIEQGCRAGQPRGKGRTRPVRSRRTESRNQNRYVINTNC